MFFVSLIVTIKQEPTEDAQKIRRRNHNNEKYATMENQVTETAKNKRKKQGAYRTTRKQ